MGVVINRHVLTQVQVAAASDRVIAHLQMPSETIMVSCQGQCHCVTSSPNSTAFAVLYGVDGFVLPDPQPGTIDSIDDVWDIQVTKDDDFSGGIDIDALGSDAQPVFEPGEPNISDVMDLGVVDDDNRFFKRRKMVSFATSPSGFVDGTPDSFIPTDQFNISVNKQIQADYQSYAMLGFSAPAFDDVLATVPNTLGTEAAWAQIKYINVVLEQAWMDILGLTEAGAETPWEDAADLLEDLLEPNIHEETAGSFTGQTWVVFTAVTFQLWVPGSRAISQITGG